MAIFQKSVIKKHLNNLNKDLVDKAYLKYKVNYNQKKIEEIKILKEEEYQDGFLRDIFVDVLGYTLRPDENFNLLREYKNQTDSKKADGAILVGGKAIAVIELKSTTTKDLKSITQQAFKYKNDQPGCKYVITSNFHKLHFYIDYSNEYEELDLFNLNRENFELFYLILSKESIVSNLPLKIKDETKFHEQKVSEKLYKDYSHFKSKLFETITKNHPESDKLILFKKTQKLIDRFLFILFAEDSGLLPPNSISRIIDTYHKLQELDAYKPIYDIFKQYFGYMNIGRKGKTTSGDIPAYNGGLFHIDKLLNNLKIDDEILINELLNLSQYDFNTEVDVNILGHIFEHSLNEIEEVSAEIEGTVTDKSKSRRKKEGVFYTPKYITQYIVENTIGTLCYEKRKELDIVEIEFDGTYRTKGEKLSKKGIKLYQKLKNYKDWLVTLKIIDPACGSGAFLNQALDFLIEEHKTIDDIIAELTNSPLRLFDIDKSILENNLYGVDINEESVEIAKLSLWLRTAQKGRKLSSLNNNIKCGNSLVDNYEIVGDKAFDWDVEFKDIMQNGGFDIVIGNPPYVFTRGNAQFQEINQHIWNNYNHNKGKLNLYSVFLELSLAKLLKPKGKLGFITPETFIRTSTYQRIRQYLINNFNIVNVQIYGIGVFNNVTAETVVLIIENDFNKNNKALFEKINDYDESKVFEEYQNNFNNTPANRFVYGASQEDKNIFKKIRLKGELLENIVDVRNGIATKSGKNSFISKNKLTDKYKKLLEAPQLFRYGFQWNGNFINYDREVLHRPRNENTFLSNKILIQRVSSRLICSYDNEKYYTFNSVNNLILINDYYNLKYIISILNSKLIDYFYRKNYSLDASYTITVTKQNLNSIPIPKIIKEHQQPFIEKANKMLDLNKQLQERKDKFLKRVNDNFELDKVSKKLDTFYKYDFKTFVGELKKQKVILSLTKQDEWEDYFDSYKNEINQLQMDISKIDNEIDQMVYEMYGLNEKEIEIIENG